MWNVVNAGLYLRLNVYLWPQTQNKLKKLGIFWSVKSHNILSWKYKWHFPPPCWLNPYVVFGSPVTRFKLKLYNNYALVFFDRNKASWCPLQQLYKHYKTDFDNFCQVWRSLKKKGQIWCSGLGDPAACCGWLEVKFGPIKIHLWL